MEADKDGNYSIVETDEPTVFAVTGVTDVFGKVLTDEEYDVKYYTEKGMQTVEGEKGAEEDGGAPADAGKYYIGITPAGDYKATYDTPTPVKYVPFEITAAPATSIANAKVYQVNADDPSDVSDTDFVYTGQAFSFGNAEGNLNIAIDGTPLEFNNDYTVSGTVGANAGSYELVITGAGEYTGTLYVTVVVQKLDLTTADISIADQALAVAKDQAIDGDMVSINGKTVTAWRFGNVEYAIDSYTGFDAAGNPASGAPSAMVGVGKYTATVSAKDGATNITGSKTVEFNVVTDLVSDFKYDDKAFDSYEAEGNGLVFNNSVEGSAFDKKEITVTKSDGKTVLKEGEDYTVTVTKDGQEVTTWTEPGDYIATVQVNVDAKYTVGGKDQLKFRVINGEVKDADSVFVAVNGKNVVSGTPAKVAYTGAAVTPVVVVYAGDKALTAGTDYTVTYENDKTGEAVESIVEPGLYNVVIESDSYNMPADLNFQVEVGKVAITKYRVVQQTVGTVDPAQPEQSAQPDEEIVGIPYTGAPVTVAIEYTTDELVNGEAPEDAEWVALDASLYELSFKTDPEKGEAKEVAAEDLIEVGSYTATVELTEDAVEYYDDAAAGKDADFKIVGKVLFQDVNASDWFAGYVWDAKQLGYMNGVNGTNLFLPNNAITRAEIAQVIYNMAGADTGSTLPPYQFDDIEMGAWYTTAVSFVNGAEIMTGYDDSDSFGVYNNATREEIATIMYRYAKVVGIDTTVEDEAAALAKYADGDQVSGFAKTAVAWAVENGIMGVDVDVLNPQGDVLRAEVAAIATRVQPEAI